MQIRRLVKSGAASHTVSLPKNWISKNNLKKGDLLYLVEDSNNIVISTDTKEPEIKEKEVTIQIDGEKTNTLRRKTIAAYMNNYQLFTFHGNELNKRLEDIRKILHNFLALEIVEQTATRLVAKDFLNLKEFSLSNTLRRMDMLTRSIITDAKKGKSEYQALYFRDFEVDKLFFLISRLVRSHFTDQNLQISNQDAHETWWLAKNLESISDAAKKMTQVHTKELEKIYDEIEEFYLNCAKAYFKNDKKLADNMIDKRIELLKNTDNIKGDAKPLLKAMINNSRNIAKIIQDKEN